MPAFDDPLREDVHLKLQALWIKAALTDSYVKAQWKELEAATLRLGNEMERR